MKFKILDYFRLQANCYCIEIYATPLSIQDYLVICEKIRYYCKKDGISWMAVYSTTDSNTAKSTVIHTKKRGRPQKVIQGKKVDGHIHNLFIGNENKSAYSTVNQIKKSLDKKYKKPICKVVSKGRDYHAYNTMCYNLKQADIVRTGGDFDFKEYVNSHDLFC